MFKKIRKLLQEDFTQLYQNFEERYLRFENKLYKTMEERLATLERRFDDLADALNGKKTEAPKSKKEKREKETTAAPETPVEQTKSSAEQTDLQSLKGLGKTMAEKLKAAGVARLQQLAELDETELKRLDDAIPGFAVRYERYEWRKQAKALLHE